MGPKVKALRGILFKVLGFFTAGVLVSMALLANTDTFGWFSSRVTSGLQVHAASAEDIIEDFYTLSDVSNNIGENPNKIIVKRAQDLKYNPVVYFSVDGEISRYIMHINPVRLTNDEVQIPLRIKVNYRDLNDIIGQSSFTGNITLKYLNEFIIQSYPVTFTRGYLLTQYLGLQDRGLLAKFNSHFDVDRELTPYIAQIINDIAGNIQWKNVMEQGRVQRLEKDSGSNENMENVAFESAFNIPPAAMNRARMIEPVENIMYKIQLTNEQQSIMDVVAPGLREYIDALYGYVEHLINELNEKIAEINELYLTIDDMNGQIQGLNATIDDMTQKYAALEQEKVALLQEKLDFEQDNMRLKDKIDGLEDRIGNLESANDSLRDEIRRLRDQNDSLREEIENLRNSAPPSTEPGESPPAGAEQPPDGSTPPAEVPPPAINPPDEGANDGKTGQPPSQEPGEQPPAGQEPGEQPPAGQEPGEQPTGGQEPEEQPPVGQEPGEQLPAGQEPGEQPPAGQEPGAPSSDGQPPAGVSIEGCADSSVNKE